MKVKLIIMSFFLSSCSLFNSEESSNDIYGIWYCDNGNAGYEITVSESTTAVNPFKSNGSISISGSVNHELKYIWKNDTSDNDNYLVLSNYPIVRVVDIIIYLVIDLQSNDDNFAIYIYNAEGNTSITGHIDYIFDGTSLTINDFSITSDDVQLTFNGTNSLEYIKLNPSTATKFGMASEAWYNEPRTLNIKESGTVIWTQTLNYNGDLDPDSETMTMQGLWGYDELVYSYELIDNRLSLALDNVLCYATDADCIAEINWNLNIDPTIIESISIFDECEFESAD